MRPGGGGFSIYCYVIGLKNSLPSVASIIAMIEPITATLFGVFVLGEGMDMMQLAGMALILVAITTLSLARMALRYCFACRWACGAESPEHDGLHP
ncbi:EamA family transporter [Cobetia marina]